MCVMLVSFERGDLQSQDCGLHPQDCDLPLSEWLPCDVQVLLVILLFVSSDEEVKMLCND